jgi:SAM-dependent methyltransferase
MKTEGVSEADRATREHAKHDSWWDGPKMYAHVNRNIISMCQTNTIRDFIAAFFKDGIGFDIGGPGFWKRGGPYGLDIDPITAETVNADGACLPFKDNSLDYIFSFHTFEHISKPKQALDEWIRVVKPGGLIYTVIPDKRYFTHSKDPKICEALQAPNEIEPFEMENILNDFSDKIEILMFNSRNNFFDFDFLARKK